MLSESYLPMKKLLSFLTLLLAAILFTGCEKEEINQKNTTPPNYITTFNTFSERWNLDPRIDTMAPSSFVFIRTHSMENLGYFTDEGYCLPIAYADSFPDNLFDEEVYQDSLGYVLSLSGIIEDRSGRGDSLAWWLYK